MDGRAASLPLPTPVAAVKAPVLTIVVLILCIAVGHILTETPMDCSEPDSRLSSHS